MGKKSKKKKRAKNANESISLMDIMGRIYFVICIGFTAYICIGIPILLYLSLIPQHFDLTLFISS